MNLDQQDQTLQVAQAAARRLLVRAIDLRFDLDDTADAVKTDRPLTRVDLLQLRAETDAVREEIDRLAQLLWPLPDPDGDEEEEVAEAATAARG